MSVQFAQGGRDEQASLRFSGSAGVEEVKGNTVTAETSLLGDTSALVKLSLIVHFGYSGAICRANCGVDNLKNIILLV